MYIYFTTEDIKNILKDLLCIVQTPCPKCLGTGVVKHESYSYPCHNVGCVEGFIDTPPPKLTSTRIDEVVDIYVTKNTSTTEPVDPKYSAVVPHYKSGNSVYGKQNLI